MTATVAGRIDAAERPGESDFAGVLARQWVGIWRYLRFFGASSHLAEDLTQETLLAALSAGILPGRSKSYSRA